MPAVFCMHFTKFTCSLPVNTIYIIGWTYKWTPYFTFSRMERQYPFFFSFPFLTPRAVYGFETYLLLNWQFFFLDFSQLNLLELTMLKSKSHKANTSSNLLRLTQFMVPLWNRTMFFQLPKSKHFPESNQIWLRQGY